MSGRPLALRRLEAALLLPIGALLRRLSPRLRVRLGHALGSLAHALDGGHRRLARKNVALSLGCDEAESARIARAAFRHFGRVLVEVLALPDYLERRELFEIEGFEHLEKARALGRGVIVFSAHYGNWELVAQQQALAGVPMDFIARPLDNPWLDEAFTRWRELSGNRVLGKHGALRGAMKSLRAGRSLAILIDQNVRTPPRLFFEFFGRRASVTPTLGSFAARLDAPVVPVISYPKEDGGYRIVYFPPLERDGSAGREEETRRLSACATAMIESWIRDEPEHWLWLHDRWKSQPKRGELRQEDE